MIIAIQSKGWHTLFTRVSGLKWVKKQILGKSIFFGNFYPNSFFSHKFWTRDARKPIKGSTDSDFSLVSRKNFSVTLDSCNWGPGPDNLSQKRLNPWCHSQKIWNPKVNFSHCKL